MLPESFTVPDPDAAFYGRALRQGRTLARSSLSRLRVRDGKTPIEHMFSGLPQIADIR
jgi:hypothetical protein